MTLYFYIFNYLPNFDREAEAKPIRSIKLHIQLHVQLYVPLELVGRHKKNEYKLARGTPQETQKHRI